MNKIVNFIEHLECPIVDGIVFPDNTIQLFDIKIDWNNRINYIIKATSKTSISTLDKEGGLWWGSCAILTHLINREHSIEILAGEGNYGSDGFISVVNLNSKAMIWLAYFKNSNPFNKVKIIGEEIQVTSTVECIWRFKINEPMNFIVECIQS